MYFATRFPQAIEKKMAKKELREAEELRDHRVQEVGKGHGRS